MQKSTNKQQTAAPLGQVERIVMPHNEIWIDAQNNLPPDNEKVIVCKDQRLLFCAVCQRISRHVGENAPLEAITRITMRGETR